jgi:hypothetical protein
MTEFGIVERIRTGDPGAIIVLREILGEMRPWHEMKAKKPHILLLCGSAAPNEVSTAFLVSCSVVRVKEFRYVAAISENNLDSARLYSYRVEEF